MTASTTDRNTPRRGRGLLSVPVAAAQFTHNGLIACINAGGFAIEGSGATNLIYLGRFEEDVDNTEGVDGALSVMVRTNAEDAFLWANDTANPVLQANLGTVCYILDNQTVTADSAGGTLSACGRVVEVTPYGVWVE